MLKTPACLLLAALLLGACHDKTEAPAAPKADTAQTAPSADSRNDQPAAEAESKGDAVHAGLQPFADLTAQVRAELQQGGDAEQLYLRHHADVDKLLEKLNDSDTDFLKDAPDIKDLPQKEAALKAAGLRYVYGEGASVTIIPVADYYSELFGKAAAKDLREFLALEASDNENFITDEYSATVPDLGKRIAAWEDWAAEFPQSKGLNAQAAKWLKDYRRSYLLNGEADPAEVEKEWSRFAAARPNSETAQLIDEARRYQKARQESDGEPDLSGYSAPFKNLLKDD